MRNQKLDYKIKQGKAFFEVIIRTGFPNVLWAHPFLDGFIGYFVSAVKHRGIREAIKEVKQLRLDYTRGVSETSEISSEAEPGKNSFPHLLKRGGLPSNREPETIKLCLSILVFTRSFKLPAIPDIGSIEDPGDRKIPDDFQDFLKVAIKPWMKRIAEDVKGKGCHYSTKSGPNGQAMYTSFEDIKWIGSIYTDLITLGGPEFGDLLTKIFDEDESIGMSPFELISGKYPAMRTRKCARRLAFISDKEGKTRTIGVVDYGSQTVLKPYHDGVTSILRKLKCDMTFRQSDPLAHIPLGEEYLSADLKAATDSFSIELQMEIVKALFGEQKAQAWRKVMTGIPFKTPHREEPVGYRRGQPMGAYSSGPVFSLTHHLLIQYAAGKEKSYPFTKYAVLGDDVVICDRTVGRRYLELCRDLDIPLSLEKSMWSKTTYEFAKRGYVKGVEVSPFPIAGLFENVKYYHTLHNLLENANRKGYPCFDNESGPNRELFTSLWETIDKRQQSKRLLKKVMVFHGLTVVSKQSEFLPKVLSELYPKGGVSDFTKEVLQKGKLLLVGSDLFKMQEFYNKELDALKSGHVVQPYKQKNLKEVGQAAPAYEYADVGPPLNVARRLIRSYLETLDAILINHKEECQLNDESLIKALLETEVPSFVISRRVINERTARKRLGAKARLVSVVMDLGNQHPVKAVDEEFLNQRFGVVIELDFDEWDQCKGRVLLEPMSIREERFKKKPLLPTR